MTQPLDTWQDPCDDFYEYACGHWYSGGLPGDPWNTQVSRAFNDAEKRTAVVVWQLLDEAREAIEDPARASTVAPPLAQAQAFLAQCLDERELRRVRIAPLDSWIAEIRAIRDLSSFTAILGKLHAMGIPALFSFAVNPGAVTSDIYALELSQGGLSLASPDWYLARDSISLQAQRWYKEILERTLVVTEDSRTAERLAAGVLAFETDIARLWLTPEEVEDAPGSYDETDCAELQQKAPELSWKQYCAALGIPESARITLATPTLFSRLGSLVGGTKIDVLRAYVQVQFFRAVIPFLADSVTDDTYGIQTFRLPRWQRCAGLTYEAFPDVLEPLYVERLRTGEIIDRVAKVAEAVRSAVPAMVDSAGWMDAALRARAKARIAAAKVELGLPTRQGDSDRPVNAPSFFASAIAARRAVFAEHMHWVGQPVEATHWILPPLTANAAYVYARNAVLVPVGVLQAPLFHPDFPTAMNFGAIGSVLGHEIMHAFQPQALYYDLSGCVDHSWKGLKSERGDKRTQCVAKQYGYELAAPFVRGYGIDPHEHYDAAESLREDLADIGGVTAAYRAYKQSAPDELRSGIADLSGDQLFFVAFAQMWCSNASKSFERILARIDSHAPPRIRVNGALANVPAFAAAFGCAAGSKMNPETRCESW